MAKKRATEAEQLHMDRVAKLPCMLGMALGEMHGNPSVHHIREGQGASQRASHFLTVPLCHDCHQGPNGVHGNRSLLRIAKVEELDLLAMTIEEIERGF